MKLNKRAQTGLELPVLLALIIGLAIAIPIFVGGMGIVVKLLKILFTPVGEGSVPIWMVFAGGFLFIYIYRKYLENRYELSGQ